MGRIDRDRIQPVDRSVIARELVSDLIDFLLDIDRPWRQQIAVGKMFVYATVDERVYGRDVIGMEIHRSRGVRDIGNDLERRPQSGHARQRNRVTSKRQRLRRIPRIEKRQMHVCQYTSRRRWNRRTLGRRIIAHDGDCSAVHRGPCIDRVAKCIRRAIHPGRLAIPEADDASIETIGLHRGELQAHDRACGVFLVHCRTAAHRQIGRQSRRFRHGPIVSAERRARIPRDERGGIQSSPSVDSQLFER